MISQPFKSVTLSLSREGVPTICLVLPMYKSLELHMQEELRKHKSNKTLSNGLEEGLAKLDPYMNSATHGKYHLLGVGMCYIFMELLIYC